jgi:hypothetical protein
MAHGGFRRGSNRQKDGSILRQPKLTASKGMKYGGAVKRRNVQPPNPHVLKELRESD